jgi:DNA (cytosine-5)-methyltransferase 1
MVGKYSKKIEAIDLFSGIGGLTYGLKKAGINVIAGLDNDDSCAFAYEKNNNAKFINADIVDYNFNDLKKLYSDNCVKVLVGCAPCQPFSSHTFKARGKKKRDARWNLLDYFVRAIQVIKPEIVSMENVRGVTRADVFKNFVDQLIKMNYKVNYEVVYTPNYGVPQNRSRLILLASRFGKIEIPKKTHKKGNYVTVGDVIRGLPKISAGQKYQNDLIHQTKNLSPINMERIRQSKPRGTWRDWDKKLLPKCYKKESGQTYTSVYGRMSWNDVSPTITTQFFSYGSGRFGHPEQNRAISIREGALLQTFPLSYDFGNLSATKLGVQIGNAVPPRLGFVIGTAIKEHVNRLI